MAPTPSSRASSPGGTPGVTHFKGVKEIEVTFSPHHTIANLHEQMNMAYGNDVLPNHQRIFVDPDKQEQVKGDAELIALVRDIIIQEMIAPHALATPGADISARAANIRMVMRNALLHVVTGPSKIRRLTSASMTDALRYCRDNSDVDTVKVFMTISHLYVNPKDANVFNWSNFDEKPFPSTTVAPAPTPAPVPAPTPVPGPSATDIATAVASAIASSLRLGTAGTPTTTTSGSTTTAAAPTAAPATAIFNPRSLPTEVRERYDANMANRLLPGSTITRPFNEPAHSPPQATDYRHYLVPGTNILVLADGSLFELGREINVKGASRDPVLCTNDTHAGIQTWYINFIRFLHGNGIYAHPLYLFRKGHGGAWGFKAGNDISDDLPHRMLVSLEKMSMPIFRLLSRKDMFPTGSKLQDTVRSCNGDGYRALKNVLYRSHPAFYDQPSTLVTAYPKQLQSMSIQDYFNVFNDYLKLKAYIENHTVSIGDPPVLDVFLARSNYSEYLNRVTRDERRQPALAHKYAADQVLDTVTTFLSANDAYPDKQHINSSRGNGKSSFVKSFKKLSPTSAKVNALAINNTFSTSSSDSDASLNDLASEAFDIQSPEESQSLYHNYVAGIFKISAEPANAKKSPCIVCGGEHRFEQCTVLLDTEFLRSHYIRYCQQIRREADARAKSFSGTQATIPINFVDECVVEDRDIEHEDEASDDDMDFYIGRP
jgi:hypothetical protein